MRILGLIAALAIAAPTAATAQAQSQSPARPQSLAGLHDALQLTPQQEPAWRAYAAGQNVPAAADARRRSAAKLFPGLPAPRRMDLVEAEMQQEIADLRQQSAALKTFYATLTKEQQQRFDAATLPPPDDEDGPRRAPPPRR